MPELTDEQKLQLILETQAEITKGEVARMCAIIADKNRGFLSIGDLIRKHYNIVDIPPEPEKKESHLKRIK